MSRSDVLIIQIKVLIGNIYALLYNLYGDIILVER